MELLETVTRLKSDDDEVQVHLVTVEDEFNGDQQKGYLMNIQENIWNGGIRFSWEFVPDKSIHARHIVTDNGWKILLDRGLDVFRPLIARMPSHFPVDYRSIGRVERLK